MINDGKTIVATAIPKITDEFHGLDKVGWYASAYFMTFGGWQAPWGKAYKYFPLKITFLVAIFIFELGSLICGVAPGTRVLPSYNPSELTIKRCEHTHCGPSYSWTWSCRHCNGCLCHRCIRCRTSSPSHIYWHDIGYVWSVCLSRS
jgi:MFS family permease